VAVNDGYPYIAFIINWSQIWAVYCLFWFYHSFQDELRAIRPFPKAMCIKGVVFLTFWQSVFISLLVHYDAIHATENFTVEEVASGLQDFLICIEMFIAAVAHERFFNVKEWENKTVDTEGRIIVKPASEMATDANGKSPKHKGPVLQRFYSFISPRDIAHDLKDVMIKSAPQNRNSISGHREVTATPTTASASASSETTETRPASESNATEPAKPTQTSADLE